MTREQTRLLQRQGQLDANGNPSRRDSRDPSRRRERVTVRQFFTQVRDEMRQVSWPSRIEVRRYTSIVLFVLVFMTALIFGLGFGVGKIVNFLYG